LDAKAFVSNDRTISKVFHGFNVELLKLKLI